MAELLEQSPDVSVLTLDERLERIEARLAVISEAFNKNAEAMQWIVDNTKGLFGFIQHIQENGGPAALMGMMGKANG